MPRRSVVLLPALCLLLTGCFSVEVPSLMAPTPEEPAPVDQDTVLAATEPAADAATARLAPSCPAPDPEGEISAAQLNQALTRIDFPEWQSADLGASAVLSDGRVLWVWGDTGREDGFSPQMVDNSVLVSSGACFSQLVTEEGGEVFERNEDGLSIWPMSVVRLEPTAADGPGVRDVVVVYLSRIQRGDRQYDFLYRGSSVAIMLVGEDGVPRLDRTVELTSDSAEFDQINWGAAATVDGDWMYLYGTRYTAEAFITGRELYVSRLPRTDPTNARALQYWDGARWQTDLTQAAPIMSAVDGTSQTVSVDKIDQRWVVISKRGGDLADSVSMWTADQPTGPFGEGVPVLDAPFQEGDDLMYTPLSHPDIRTRSGSLLISVSRNTTDLDKLFTQPQSGRVLFAEVPLV